MEALKVSGLAKSYEKFRLEDVSFTLDEGFIMGFIGRNGAGKTTTLKSMLGLVRREAGRVEVYGRDMDEHEMSIKKEIGFMMGGSDYYLKRKARTVAETASRFYEDWNRETWEGFLDRFKLDMNRKVGELSQGMRIKFALAMALSHEAKLIILDEPTSGLDPVARDSLLELFQELVEDGKKSILFSTHITSDLEKCADYITFIQNGRIIDSRPKDDLIDSYRIISGSNGDLASAGGELISSRKNSFGSEGLVRNPDPAALAGLAARHPNLDDIMIYHARKEDQHA